MITDSTFFLTVKLNSWNDSIGAEASFEKAESGPGIANEQ